jgi:hypothetical protein
MKENLPATGAVRDTTWLYREFGEFILLSEADYALLRALKPRCAVCNRPVDSVDYAVDPATRQHMIFTAHCHGDWERNRLSKKELKMLLAYGVQGGEAFGGRFLE